MAAKENEGTIYINNEAIFKKGEQILLSADG